MNRRNACQHKELYKALLLSTGTFFLLLSNTELKAQEPTNTLQTTTVYKVINPDGSISYSDQAQSNAVKLDVAPVPTIPAYKPITDKLAPSSDSNKSTPYESFTILNPANGTTFHSGSGNISVSTKLEPSLKPEDQIRFLLDDSEVKVSSASSIQLNNIDRGTHSITAQVIDQSSNTLISTTNQFTIHRPIAKRK